MPPAGTGTVPGGTDAPTPCSCTSPSLLVVSLLPSVGAVARLCHSHIPAPGLGAVSGVRQVPAPACHRNGGTLPQADTVAGAPSMQPEAPACEYFAACVMTHSRPFLAFVQDDMEISTDFFAFMARISDVVDRDSSLFAVSSWNGNAAGTSRSTRMRFRPQTPMMVYPLISTCCPRVCSRVCLRHAPRSCIVPCTARVHRCSGTCCSRFQTGGGGG